MNAIEMAEVLEHHWPSAAQQPHIAAEMLRRQHKAIVKLREALEDTAQTLVWIQLGDCRKFAQRKLLNTHEAVEKTQQALADTEQLTNKGN